MKLVQDVLRNSFVEAVVENFFVDLCWFGRIIMDYDSCKGYVMGAAPPIFDGLTGFLLSPDYTCNYEISLCEREWYLPEPPQTDVDRILKSKPEYL